MVRRRALRTVLTLTWELVDGALDATGRKLSADGWVGMAGSSISVWHTYDRGHPCGPKSAEVLASLPQASTMSWCSRTK